MSALIAKQNNDPRDALPLPSDSAGFQKLYEDKKGIFIKFSLPYLSTGRIEEGEVFTTAWLCYQHALENWDPARGANPVSHWINQFRIYLFEQYGAHGVYQTPAGRADDDAGEDESGTSNRRIDDPQSLSLARSGFSVREAFSDDDPLDDWTPLTSDQVSCDPDDMDSHRAVDFFSMADFLATHPVWFHSRYRAILQSIDKEGSIHSAAALIGRSDSRARQLERKLRAILAKPDLFRDSRIPLECPISNEVQGIRYIPLDHFRCPPVLQKRQKELDRLMAQLRISQRMTVPVLYDQHGRILDGMLRFHAAKHFRMATLPAIIHPIPNARHSEMDDPAYVFYRGLYSGEVVTTISGRSPRQPPKPQRGFEPVALFSL